MTRAWLVLAVCLPIAARASDSGSVHLHVEALTDLPVQIGGRIQLEVPYGIRFATSLGAMPGSYVDLINEILVAANAYPEPTAQLIRTTLQQSLVWRTHVGWRPLSDHGFYFELGYALVTLGGGASGEELIAGITGQPVPGGSGASERLYDAASTLHMLDVEVGWEWVLWDALTLRAALGMIATVGASATVDPQFTVKPLFQPVLDGFTSFAESYLIDTYTSYVFSPVISVAVGYRIF